MRHRSLLIIAGTLCVFSSSAFAQTPKIKEAKPGLFKKARVTAEAATATALARVPAGKVESGELEEEDGKLIFSFDIKVAGKSGIEEVQVDALTGQVVKTEHESPAKEREEAAAEKKAGVSGKAAPKPVKKPPTA